ncbi:efflux RND transporter periplasmic adaptor subunit [Oxalobacteraceae bacterium A2-2]
MKSTLTIPAAATLALLSACGQAPKSAAPSAPPQVTVMAVHRTDVPISSELPGRTAAYQVAQIRARVDGIVQKREFVEGSDVRAQQPLYRIDPAPYRATLASAQAVLQKNEATLAASNNLLERYRQLVGANAVSKQVFDNAVAAQGQAAADVAAARAALETARINLGYTTVTAPIPGRISTSLVTQGAYVQASAATLLTTVEQLDPIYVDIQQSSAEGLRLRRAIASGQLQAGGGKIKVRLRLEDGSDFEQAGTLQFSGVSVDSATGSVSLRALFPNPQHLLLPGMFVRASVDQGVRPNAVLVPAGAVTRDRQGVASVLVVGKDQKVAQRQVQASILTGGAWVVDAGLAEGERVIIDGQLKVKPGATVQAQEASAAALANTSAPGVKDNG